MDRRAFMKTSAVLPLSAALPGYAFAQQLDFNPRPGAWRTFEITTRVEVLKPAGVTRAWVPVPVVNNEGQRVIDNSWSGNAGQAEIVRDGKYGVAMLYAEWPASEQQPAVGVTSRVTTRDRAIDFAKRGAAAKLDEGD